MLDGDIDANYSGCFFFFLIADAKLAFTLGICDLAILELVDHVSAKRLVKHLNAYSSASTTLRGTWTMRVRPFIDASTVISPMKIYT